MSEKKDRWIILVTIWFTFVYFIWRIFCTLPVGYGLFSMAAGMVLLVAESIGILEFLYQCFSQKKGFLPKKLNPPEEWYPDVDILITTHNEPVELLFQTVNGCCHLEYPDKEKIHIYICDDTNRQEVKNLAKKMGVSYFGISNNIHAKAGNLNYALERTSSPLVATFDADMIPRSHFLVETVPYFFSDDPGKKVGFIQTPQSFYNPDLFQYYLYSENQVPNEQDYFFQKINVWKNGVNAPIYAGSNTVLSREALKEAGGIQTGTITEDFATGIEIQKQGYSCFAIDKVLAYGLSPVDFKSLVKQRQRWGRGCIQTIFSKSFLFCRLPFLAKVSYFFCFFYWWSFLRRFFYLLSPILVSVFEIWVVDASLWGWILFWVPYFVFSLFTQRILSKGIYRYQWSNIVETALFPYLIFPFLFELFGLRQRKFHVTRKTGEAKKKKEFFFAIPHTVLFLFSITGMTLIWKREIPGSTVIFLWLCMNSYSLLMVLFFLMGRENLRSEERFQENLKVILDGEQEAAVMDLSPTGLSVFCRERFFFEKEEYFIWIKTEKEQAQIKGTLVRILPWKDGWKYCFKIDTEQWEEKCSYTQIVFDRKLPNPQHSCGNNILWVNIQNRLKRKKQKNLFKDFAS